MPVLSSYNRRSEQRMPIKHREKVDTTSSCSITSTVSCENVRPKTYANRYGVLLKETSLISAMSRLRHADAWTNPPSSKHGNCQAGGLHLTISQYSCKTGLPTLQLEMSCRRVFPNVEGTFPQDVGILRCLRIDHILGSPYMQIPLNAVTVARYSIRAPSRPMS